MDESPVAAAGRASLEPAPIHRQGSTRMSAALVVALVWTVLVLVISVYFLMSSVPLLILKHDTPMDARFVRGFFDTYYRLAFFAAGAAAASYALAGRPVFAAGGAALAVWAFGLRRFIIPRMDALRAGISLDDPRTARPFRRVHVAAILASLAQVVVTVASLVAVSIQMK
jgi:hypothetical protein